ncbi:hypothetical protein OF829_15010 [Sphingomonas sp. LB-2]|uniref:hypothetical protein n=1 Tax=Sphingomonas caeni TaxID=2984949 RepID=UPI002230EFBC|nr:hypothetical protein [Sphingomonas caeni]MCW3848543.1 hypothetical protein [Sphingomonas caeni]
MGEFLPLVRKGAGYVGLADDLEAIEALVKIAESWAGPERPAKLADLLTKAIADIDDASVKKVFGDLGLEPVRAKVAALLAKVKAAGAKIPDWAKTLARPLDSFGESDPGALSWTPLKLDETVPLDEPFTLGVKASAVLSCAASTTTEAFGSPATRLLKIAAHGDVSAQGGAEIPYAMGAIKAGASAGAALDLAYYYATGDKRIYVAALAEGLARAPLPFDYSAVWEAAARPGFAGVDYVFAANAGANLDVGLAYLIEAGDLKFDLGGKVSVAASYAKGYRLTLSPVQREGATALAISLKRTRLSALTIGASLSVTVDAPKLRAKVQDIVKTKLKLWDAARAEIQTILSPGTFLQTKLLGELGPALDRLVKNEALRNALAHDLGTVLGQDSSDAGLADWLSDAIKGAIDRASASLTGKAETAVTEVTDKVMADLGNWVPDEAKAAVKAEIAKLIGSVHTGFGDAVQKLLDSFAGDGKAFQKLLQDAGAKVQGAIKTIDDAFAGVRDLLTKYNAAIHDIAEKAQAAAEKKISIAITVQNKRTHELTLTVKGVFTDPNKAADMFGWLTRGDLKTIRKHWDDLVNGAHDGFLLDPASSIEEHDRLEQSVGFEIMVLGFGATYSEKLTVDAKSTLDAAGNVLIDTSANYEKRVKGGNVERTASFGDVLGVAAAKSLAEGQGALVSRTMRIGVSASYQDGNYSAAKLAGFLDDLESPDHLLITSAEGADARAAFAKLVAGSAGGTAKAGIAAELWLDDKLAQSVMLFGEAIPGKPYRDPTGMLAWAGRRRVFEAGLEGLLSAGTESNTRSRKETLKKLTSAADFIIDEERDQIPTPLPADLAGKFLLFSRGAVEEIERYHDPRSFPGAASDDANRFVRTYYRLDDLATAIERLGLVYRASPVGDEAWSAKRYEQQQEVIAYRTARWLAAGSPLFAKDRNSVEPVVLALMLTLEDLAGGIESPVVLTLTDYSDPVQPRALVI